MAQRTVALCDGRYIGIETIYTIVDGRQINIPDKLKALRERGRHNELFCPCGCGRNLIVVAGDKNLREQHYRIKEGSTDQECRFILEGQESIDSKIVLKCWLDEKLQAEDLETRVPICAVDDTSRKYEFSFLSREKKTAVCFCRARENLSDEKLEILDNNSQGIRVFYIVCSSNGGCGGQFPENLMKIQERQGYCLLLTVDNSEYDKARLKVVFYAEDIYGYWQEIKVVSGFLKDYSIDGGRICYKGETLNSFLEKAKASFEAVQKKEAARIEEEERQREETFARQRRLSEELKQREQKRQEEALRIREEFKENLPKYFEQQTDPVFDPDGNRLIKCEFCGKIALAAEFVSYGGAGRMNLGKCKDCLENNPKAKVILPASQKKQQDVMTCPECGGILQERNGRYGRFLGCSNYPRCRYTRRVF